MRPGQYITFDKGLLGLVHLKNWQVSKSGTSISSLDIRESKLELCLEKVRLPSALFKNFDFPSILESCSILHTNYEVYLVSKKEGVCYDLSEPIIIDYISSRGYHVKVADKSLVVSSMLIEMLNQSHVSLAKL